MAKDLKRRIIAEFSAQNKAKGEMAGFRRDMDRTGQSMKNMAKGALAMVGLGGGLYAVKRAFDYVTKAAMKQEDALFLLEAALKAAGEYSAETMKGFEAFAASIQKATVYGDEEVLALMQLMKSLGVTSDALEQATKMAIGLAAATGRDVRSMSMYIALAQQGEFTMLRRYIPALRSTTDATEQLRIITEFAARGFKIAEAQAETTSGALKQMANAFSDLAEAIAEPYLEPMTKDLGSLTILIQGATEALKKFQGAAEKVRESREKLGLRPMGFPRVPIVSPLTPYIEERLEKRYPTPIPEVILSGTEPLEAWKDWSKRTLAADKVLADARKEQVETMAAHRAKMMEQGATLDMMYHEQMMERDELAAERKKKLMEEAERITEEQQERHKRISEEYAMATANAWTDAFMRMATEGQKFGESMKQMLKELFAMIIRIYMYRRIAEPLAKKLMGPSIIAAVPAAMPGQSIAPSGTPYWPAGSLQHGGEVLETGWAKVHKGETYSGVGRGRLEVNVTYKGDERPVVEEAEFDFKQQVLNITMQAFATDGAFRRSIKQASR